VNFDVGYITEIAKQALGTLLSMGQVNTAAGQGIMKFVDFFGMLGNFFVKGISAIGSLFGGLFG